MTEIGEKAFLRALLPQLSQHKDFVNGFGHDTSVLDLGLDRHLAFKIDRAPSPVALSRGWCDHRVWGRLAVVANVSDLLASAAEPRAMMLSLVLPGDFDADAAAEIVAGCQESCEQHGLAFVGGDTKEGLAAQVIGAALGTVDKGYWLGRASASPGDHLIIAGQLGGFTGALSILDSSVAISSAERHGILSILTQPAARIGEGAYLRECMLAHAACDLSDGLYDALSIFCNDGAGITINEAALPIHQYAKRAASALGLPAYRFAFSVGDWAIACLVKDADVSKLFEMAPSGLELFDIGCFDDTGVRQMRTKGGNIEPVPTVINEQFRRRLEDGASYLNELLGESKPV